MRKKKVRNYPPIIVSLIAIIVLIVFAIRFLSNAVSALPEVKESESVTACSVKLDFTTEESILLTKIAMAEAEGESVEGKALVMLTILNRVHSSEFPDDIENVIFQPKQFSTVSAGGRYYTTEPNEECYKALEMVRNGWNESCDALYFESCKGSSWHNRNLQFLFQEGNHKFYR